MTGPIVICIQVRFAWWLTIIYLPLMQAAVLAGFELDQAKFAATVKRGTRLHIVKRAAVMA